MSTTKQSGPGMPLDYAPAPPRRRRWIRRGLLVIVVLGLTIAGWRYGPAAWSQAKLLYRQQQCLNYTAPPDQVVYEEEPTAAAALLADARYAPYRFGQSVIVGYYNRQPATTGVATNQVAAMLQPDCLPLLFGGASIPRKVWVFSSPGPCAIIFLHERISPAGNRRLVCVAYAPNLNLFTTGFIDSVNCRIDVESPAGLTTLPQSHTQPFRGNIETYHPRNAPNIRVFAGQPDPNDPSHFTIRYQMWGQEDVIDGRLDDQDNVTLTQRKTPEQARQ